MALANVLRLEGDGPIRRTRNIQHGGTDEIPFTEETARANAEHDRKYGWDKTAPKAYTNAFRMSGVHRASPLMDDQSIWDWINGQ